MILDAQIVAEEESLILADGSANRAAEIVVSKVAASRIVPVPGSQSADAIELIHRSMDLVGAGLQDDVRHPAGCASQFSFEITGGNVYRQQRFLRWNENLQQARTLVVVDSFELQVVAQA